MRLWLCVLTLFLAGSATAGNKAPPIAGEWPPVEIAQDIYVIHGPLGVPTPENQGFMNNPGFVITDAGVVVIDAGGSVQVGELLIGEIRKVTDKPVVATFATHIHGDHWLGNQAIEETWPDAVHYGHPHMIEQVEEGAGISWIEMSMDLTKGAIAGTRVVGAESPVDHGDTVKVGGISFKMIHNGKAHTDTDIMIQVVERDTLFLGDNCANGRLLRLEHGSYKGIIEVLDMALQTGVSVYVPGHGLTGDKSVPATYREYFSIVYAEARKGYENELSDFEVKPLLLPKVAKWQDWNGFDNIIGKHAVGAYAEIEAADF